ncbi:MAG TPA: MFS transporter [Caulobacteraceae bacterium]|nr:MFS transporter [Caulobacteraceae bacterium]
MADVLSALSRPRVGVMLALGFSSGLPFMLFGNTLGFWLAEDKVSLAAIGFLSWAGLPYLLKFVWGAAVDRLKLPILGVLGRRRSWMILAQVLVAGGLFGMALSDPRAHLLRLALFALLTGLGGATQDTVIDAWRIESAADADELGLLTAAYNLGFRAALIATEALILVVAQWVGWSAAYALYGAAMAVGLIAALVAGEPARADAVMEAKAADARVHPARAVFDAVIGPILEFFRAHGAALAALMLAMITLYHLSDYLRGPMSNPYYVQLGLSKITIAEVRASVGLAGSLIGIAAGGLCAVRLGNMPTLIVGAVIQPIAIAAFALLAAHGGDYVLISAGPMHLSAFAAVMAFDAFAIGFSGVALVTYMSTLTSLGYTATQYALLTSALAWTGKVLKGFSGLIVQGLEPGRSLTAAYGLFYLIAAAVGIPAILLTVLLAALHARRRPASL